jgi:hypothetical protein
MTGHYLRFAAAALAVLTATAAGASITAGAWSTTNHIFSPRDKLASACLVTAGGNFTMRAFGGRDVHKNGLRDMFAYDNVTAAWRQVYTAGKIPNTYATALGVIGVGDMALFGGNQDGELSHRSFIFAQATATWRELQSPASSPLPVPRQRMASWVVDARYLVSFGGASERDVLNDVWALDTQTGVWELWHDGSSSAAPSPRFDPCCSAVPNTNDTLCFGGTDTTGDQQDYWRFFNSNVTWASVTPATGLPSPRRLAHCGFVNDNEFVVWGGWDSNVGDFVGDGALSHFNVATGAVRSVTQAVPPIARDGGTMCAAGGHAHLVGGSMNNGDPTNEHLQVANDAITVVTPLTARPPERAGHSAVTIGTDIFIFFGRNSEAFLNDAWAFDSTATADAAWTPAIQEAAAEGEPPAAKPTPRTFACAAARGTVVFVYGGIDAAGKQLSDLWAFNTQTYAWALQATSGVSPGPRDSHSCAVVANRFIVGMGLSKLQPSHDWFSYNLLYQRWSAMIPSGTQPAARRAFVLQPINTTHFHVGLGIGKSTYRDWFVMGNVSAAATADEPLRPVFARFTPAMPPGDAGRRYARGEAATAGAGNRVLVCGGAISTGFPVAAQHACYQYDANANDVSPMGAAAVMPVSVSLASGTYLRNNFYVFGGQLGSDNLKLNTYVAALQVFAFTAASAMCPTGSPDDTLCMHCSPGSMNPTCRIVAPGNFSHAAYSAPARCGAGHSQWRSGATTPDYCIKCPVGTYAALPGSSVCAACTAPTGCRIGTTSNTAGAQEAVVTSAEARQPAPLRPLEWPQLITLCVFLAIAAVVIVGIVVTNVPKQQNDAEADAATVIAGAAGDADSTTPSVDAGGAAVAEPKRMLVDLRTWDRYSGEHTDLDDDSGSVLKLKTKAGGFFSLAAYCAVLVLLSLILLEFFYNTVSETKSDVPLPVLQSMFGDTSVKNDMMLVATVEGPMRSHLGSKFTDVAGACVVANTTDTCVGVARWATGSSYTAPKVVDDFTTSCALDGGACRMVVLLTGLTLHRHETSAVELVFSPALSAETIRTHVVTKTGILKREVNDFGHVKLFGDDEHASAHDVDVVPPGDTVFSGYPASTVSLAMTPTYYSTPASLLSWPSDWVEAETISSTGYHVTATALPRGGHAVDHLLFDQYFGVPVVFELFAGDASLLVTRTYRQSVIELLSEMLGAVTGLFGLFLSFVRLADQYMVRRLGKDGKKRYVDRLQAEQKRLEKDHAVEEKCCECLDGFPFCCVPYCCVKCGAPDEEPDAGATREPSTVPPSGGTSPPDATGNTSPLSASGASVEADSGDAAASRVVVGVTV